ncbi:hypothetical protein SAMN04488692_103149 [Halarsenatibacter silvermanii]|uniref:Uncharacterized protein n=1 Tax=Halarsenatibacter silvermanii TaxID=321763 RepID=A0A1G9J637_9FIRM|nr:hypothetical protein SAMN04488692_103149 [Halarsenatibacter silvermanii]
MGHLISLIIIAFMILLALGIYKPKIYLKLQKEIYGLLGIEFEFDDSTEAQFRIAFLIVFLLIFILLFLL